MNLLPAIDILGGKAVRLAKGDYSQVTVYNDNPLSQAKIFENAGATWVHVVDLDGAREGRPENISWIREISQNTTLQVEVGGGIRSLETLKSLDEVGVARFVLGTSLITNPSFVEEALALYPDKVTAGIDAKDGLVAVAGWREESEVKAEELVAHVQALGVRHLVYTDIARDGMQTGIDAARYREIAEVFGSPVIASGGIAGIKDIVDLAHIASSIEGIIAGRALYENTLDIREALTICEQSNDK